MPEQIQIKPLALLLAEQVFKDMRMYDGVPSVTTVLKILKDSDEFERFKQVDFDRYKAMLKAKALLGTALHECIHETYLSGKYKSPATPHSTAWMKFYTKE